jgi:hypothetical protein
MVFLVSEYGSSRFLRNFVPLLKTTGRHIPEDRNVKEPTHHHDNLKPPSSEVYLLSLPTRLWRSSSLGVKQLDREADRFCPSSAKVINAWRWSSASTPTFVFSAQHLCTCITFPSTYITQPFSANRPPTYRWFDPSILAQHVQIPKRSSFLNQPTIANAHAHWRYSQAHSRRPAILVVF